jgi:hypothetical protein
VEVDPVVREAIVNEVYQALHDTMSGILAEAMMAMGGRKDEAKKKKQIPEMQVITESEEQNDTEESDGDARRGHNYGAFKRCNPPSFGGTKDVSVAHQWLLEIEAVIRISECREEQKVKFASHSFVSEALCW